MEIFFSILGLLGGLAMFLYGMDVMGNGLKSSSGGVMKTVLAKVTNKPFIGFLFGMLVTAMIQSSHATIVLTVGLVGAGFMTFEQSIGIILGANVGTAITAQIIRLMDVDSGGSNILALFKAQNLAPIALVIGILLLKFIKKDSTRNAGTILTGFGVLFMGLLSMSSSVASMGDKVTGILSGLDGNYPLGFVAGAAVTMLIQSSSAVVGILQSMASGVGGLAFTAVFPIILGINIGDCITAFLVCRIGAKPEQIRVAAVHVIYNIFAATLLIILLVIGHATGLLDPVWGKLLGSGGIANLHGLFRLIPAVTLLPLTKLFARIAYKVFPDKPLDEEDALVAESLAGLDDHLVTSPALALDRSRSTLENMFDVAIHNCEACLQQLDDYDEKRSIRIKEREEMLDRMADAANEYLIKLSPHIVNRIDMRRQNFQITCANNFERIGDHASHTANDIAEMKMAKEEFSAEARKDLDTLILLVDRVLRQTEKAFDNHSVALALDVEPMEEVVDELTEVLHQRHIQRMTRGICSVSTGMKFENILTNLASISDKCSDVGVAIIARMDDTVAGSEHEYIHNIHHSNDPIYDEVFNRTHEEYFNMLAQNDFGEGGEDTAPAAPAMTPAPVQS